MLNEILRPAAEWELQSTISNLATIRQPLEIVGSATKRSIGRPPAPGSQLLTLQSWRGIPLYEPNELVMTARTGTSLAHVEAELAARGQMLPFEPVDLGPATGGQAGLQTIGGVFSTNLSGSRRISAGSARDHVLGIRGVNGRAEIFKSGGRVLKNVTGYDVARGIIGSWGTLAVLTEVTFKVLPWPESTATLVFAGLPSDIAAEAMAVAMASPYEVSGAVHLDAALVERLQNEELKSADQPLTLIRIENFAKAVSYRKGKLAELLKFYGAAHELDQKDSTALWSEIRRLSVMPYAASMLWRISTTPKMGPKIVDSIKRHMQANAFYDWAGGLVWLEIPATADAGASDIRRAVAVNGGYATLIRATPEVRASVDVFQPLSPGVERLTRGLKAAFDPVGVLNPGRMYATM